MISDDGSSDSTVDVVQEFIRDRGLEESWFVHVNPQRTGVAKNFLDCAQRTSGDVIFFCDQDDVWASRKVELMMEGFENSRDIDAMSCTVAWADSSGMPLASFRNVLVRNDHRLRRIPLSQQVRNNRSSGLTLAFRRTLLPEIERFVLVHNLMYDLSVGLIAAVHGTYWILGVPLVTHRVHGDNASAPRTSLVDRLRDTDYYIRGREGIVDLMTAALEEYGDVLSTRDHKNLSEAIRKTRASLAQLRRRNVATLAWDLFDMNPMRNRLLRANALVLSLIGRTGAP